MWNGRRPDSRPWKFAAWWRDCFTLDARSLAAFRIALGLILVCDCWLRFRTHSLMFAADGVFPPDLLREYQGTSATWSLALLWDAAWWGTTVLAVEGLAGAWLATGVGSRAATVAAWMATVSVVQRTAPAANAGDFLLVCLLFWSMFLPLGAAWAVGSRRGPTPGAVLSVASAALVLQVAAVYLGAGLAKLNDAWLSGATLSYALSVHDHGNSWGMALAEHDWLTRPATWLILALELGGPIIAVLVPQRTIRGVVVALFMLFHVAVWTTMWVGIFAPVGIAAWLPLVPAAAWDAVPGRRREDGLVRLGWTGSLVSGVAAAVAAAAFLQRGGLLGDRSLPPPGALRDAGAGSALGHVRHDPASGAVGVWRGHAGRWAGRRPLAARKADRTRPSSRRVFVARHPPLAQAVLESCRRGVPQVRKSDGRRPGAVLEREPRRLRAGRVARTPVRHASRGPRGAGGAGHAAGSLARPRRLRPRQPRSPPGLSGRRSAVTDRRRLEDRVAAPAPDAV